MNEPLRPPSGPPGQHPTPPRKSGVLKWVFLGCGGLMLLAGLLACAGCFTLGYVLNEDIRRSQEELERTCEAYLRAQPEFETEVGKVTAWRCDHHRETRRGDVSHVPYAITTSKGTFAAIVYLERKGGVWVVSGAKVSIGDRAWNVGVAVPLPEPSRGVGLFD